MTQQQELSVSRIRDKVNRGYDGVQVLDDRPDDGQKQNVTVFLPFTGLYLTYDWTGNLVETKTKAQRAAERI